MTDGSGEIQIDMTVTDASGAKQSFTTVKALREFVQKELQFWEDAIKDFSNVTRIGSIRTNFSQTLNSVRLLEEGHPGLPKPSREQQLSEQKEKVIAFLKDTSFSDTPFTKSFLNACKLGVQQSKFFWKVVTGKANVQITSGLVFQDLEGAILAYEFLHQGDTDILKRRDSEERSFESLRKALTDKTDEVIRESDRLMKGFSSEADALKKSFSADTDKLKEGFSSDAQREKSALKEWMTQEEQRVTEQRSDAEKKISELETLYTEKLKLAAPAQYWRKKATELRTAGRLWGGTLIGATLAAILLFVWLFTKWLTSGEMVEAFSTRHWQGIILLLTILSLVAFILRTFGRLTFSAFHLQRDAEEREQLTYVYLALAKETTFNDDSRKVIMQALFSRADSGLLPGDHGPTMPNVAEIVSNVKK